MGIWSIVVVCRLINGIYFNIRMSMIYKMIIKPFN